MAANKGFRKTFFLSKAALQTDNQQQATFLALYVMITTHIMVAGCKTRHCIPVPHLLKWIICSELPALISLTSFSPFCRRPSLLAKSALQIEYLLNLWSARHVFLTAEDLWNLWGSHWPPRICESFRAVRTVRCANGRPRDCWLIQDCQIGSSFFSRTEH